MNIARIATLKLELVGDLVNETICPIIRESTMDNGREKNQNYLSAESIRR